MRTWSLIAFVSLIVVAQPGRPRAARAADVSGRITLPAVAKSAAGPAAREAVVYLESASTKAPPKRRAVIDQRDKVFLPHVSVVPVGTTIEFPNNDAVFHNVFAYFEAKKFDLGMYPRGATRSKTFDRPGLVALLCNIHSEMSAYIYVVDTPFYAVTDRSGRFRMEGVVPGTYTLKAWHETGATLSQTILVGSEGSSAATGLALRLVRRR